MLSRSSSAVSVHSGTANLDVIGLDADACGSPRVAADSLFPGSPSVASSVSWQVALLSRSSTAVSVHSGTANLDVVGLMLMPAAHRGCRGLPPASGLAAFACGSDWCRRHSLLAEFCDGFGLAESRGPSSSSDEVRARCRPLIHTPRVGLGVISTGEVLCALLVLVVSFHFLEYASVLIFFTFSRSLLTGLLHPLPHLSAGEVKMLSRLSSAVSVHSGTADLGAIGPDADACGSPRVSADSLPPLSPQLPLVGVTGVDATHLSPSSATDSVSRKRVVRVLPYYSPTTPLPSVQTDFDRSSQTKTSRSLSDLGGEGVADSSSLGCEPHSGVFAAASQHPRDAPSVAGKPAGVFTLMRPSLRRSDARRQDSREIWDTIVAFCH